MVVWFDAGVDTGRREPVPAPAAKLIARARAGDERAFDELVAPLRGRLLAHCYRMLGSLHDAEDALQDTLLRAWRGLGGFDAARSLRPWLYRIATNVCLDQLRRRPRRVMPPDAAPPASPAAGPGVPADDVPWLEPFPDGIAGLGDGRPAPDARYEEREAVELAFVVALQRLPPNQRAVLLLRDVLGFSARETAAALDTSEASANSALQRARATVAERLPERSQQATLRAIGDDELRRRVDAYVDAWERRDIDAIVALLAADATFLMPPFPNWFAGREAVAALIADAFATPPLRCAEARANGQPALGWYVWSPEAGRFEATALEVYAFDATHLTQVAVFASPELFPAFGLPAAQPS